MTKPNVVIIYCDDLGYGDLGCYGSDVIRTPHLDALAQDGVRFTDWYSNSPVCSPSRAALLTGLYPAKAGVSHILGGKRGTGGLKKETKTLAERLKGAGYRTALYGKWHLGSADDAKPNARGFDDYFGFHAGCIDYYSHIFYWGVPNVNPVHDLWSNREEVWRDGEYMTHIITDKSVDFIERGSEQPFFLYAAYNAPHYPMHAPEKYMKRYSHLPTDRKLMAAMISAVDDGVGDIVAALKRAGVYDNTIIFFSSDNGPSSESRNFLDGTEDVYYGGSAGIFRGHKASLFEGGIREPAILVYPKAIPSAQVCGEAGMMADILPTVLEFAGLPAPAAGEIDGTSVVKMATEGAATPHGQIFWEYGSQLAVREGKWKLVLGGKLDFNRTQPDEIHLSDLEADPGERVNLKDQYPDIASRLEQDVRRWYAELGQQA
ncbi:sulfatase-like hydrolase/transferase [Paenibacillus doosanensis]|uniref:Arylsulfatase n=1 Tax=Paenibacillus konkukensis TaxID=2020716 RepID=A0ABY4RLR1_9BACL|nr:MULTISPECIES: sulfatase-like hydrolase/transferase [Paenibacillus]MCS7462182.1 sulfatase-like hydrolase/transferase [Paenibacillus doosanensis]UQZ82955.1 Arylsulfatase [Paenibacillus konkukensis]